MKKIIVIIILILILTISIIWINKDVENKKNIITIGAVLPLSGKVSSYGIDTKNGINLAINLANNSQDKYFFKVRYQDSKGEPKTAVNALKKLISINNPIAIIGENISSSTGAMIPIINKHKLILLSPSASAPNLSGLSKYFFRVFPSDDEEGAFISNVIAKQHPNGKVTVIYVNNDYGVGLKNIFNKEAKKNKLKILSENAFDIEMKNIDMVLAKIKDKNIDAIYIPSYYENGARLVKKIRELGITSDIYGATTHEDSKFLEIAKNSAEGFQYPISTGYDENSSNKYVKNFITNYKNKYFKKPGLVTALGYDCAEIIINSVIKNGSKTEDIRNYILSTKDIQGVAGDMNFDVSGNVHKKIILKVVENGKFIRR